MFKVVAPGKGCSSRGHNLLKATLHQTHGNALALESLAYSWAVLKSLGHVLPYHLLLLVSYGDRKIFIFPVQLTTIRIGDLTRLIHTLLYVMTIHIYMFLKKNQSTRRPSELFVVDVTTK